ncbi:hypothetical protein [Micromonospora endophytica]|uniref:Uncharacterized protein n=1 Tax=Micromonospora endophytica TaxID=515350 RepID=A0A2W2E1M2_9ACTN|nr:hypothetical protein [Micromonospora endophytica]PZF98883.1 hypothetical protein C1I93_07430 [Micromonospora endophytica]RIW44380.1 hypothetical protein D3H59_18060 [Micromonospora endophytica]BCJ62419.1 hypothetical protein Jiend_58410 [Micromonospora endophytica]
MSSEFDYFGDPRFGKLFDLVLQLSTELHVSRQRLRVLEALLVRREVLGAGDVDGFDPQADEQQVLDGERDALLARLMRILTEDGPAEHPLRSQWEAALSGKSG